MAITHDPASRTETLGDLDGDVDGDVDADAVALSGERAGAEIELELVEEISIDGMCGVY